TPSLAGIDVVMADLADDAHVPALGKITAEDMPANAPWPEPETIAAKAAFGKAMAARSKKTMDEFEQLDPEGFLVVHTGKIVTKAAAMADERRAVVEQVQEGARQRKELTTGAVPMSQAVRWDALADPKFIAWFRN